MIAEGRAVNAGRIGRHASHAAAPAGPRDDSRACCLTACEVGNKTGTDSEKLPDSRGRRGAIRVDAAIVTGDKLRYVMAVFVRRGGDTSYGVDNEAVRLGAQLSRLVYERWKE